MVEEVAFGVEFSAKPSLERDLLVRSKYQSYW